MQTKISKELRFEAAHRLVGHPGLCKHIHGHSFRLRITVEADGLDEVGMGFEFGKIKAPMQHLIDTKLDHSLILNEADPLVSVIGGLLAHNALETSSIKALADVYSRVYVVPFNPTSENLAKHFWDYISGHLPEGVFLSELWFAETQSCAVTLTADHIHKLPE